MSLDPMMLSRVRTFIAAVEPRFDTIAGMFFERFSRSCTAAMNLRTPATRKKRFTFAASVSGIIKNLETLHCGGPIATRIAAKCRRVGFTDADLKVAARCLLSSLRDAAGTMWTSELESDCATVLEAVLEGINLRHTQRSPMRVAA